MKKTMDANQIKLLAILAMTIDHIALSLPVLARYNGLRGKDPRINRVMKWLFYLYYPLHLAILGTIQYLR